MSNSRMPFRGRRLVLCLGPALLLTSCIRVPQSLVTLSDTQRDNIETYNRAIEVLTSAYEEDARALMAEREAQYDALDRRAESWQKELNRLQSEIETMQARFDRLETDIALSTLTIDLRRKRVLGPLGYLGYGIWWVTSKLFVIH